MNKKSSGVLLVLIAVLAIPLCVGGVLLGLHRWRQHRVVEQVKALGAEVYRFDRNMRVGSNNHLIEGPCATIQAYPLDDAKLQKLAPLFNEMDGNLALIFHGEKISDEGLQALGSLKSLRLLILSSTKVTDAGLKHLAGLTRLTGLDVRSTAVTDRGIAGLKAQIPGLTVYK